MKAEILVPITFLVIVFFIIKTVLSYRHKRMNLWHQTLTNVVDEGQDIDKEVLKRISLAVDPQRSDLRKAILFGCISLTLCLIGAFAPFQDPKGNSVFLIAASIPFSFGLAYLCFWRFWYK